ncbi:PREDICTED: RNA polymerase II-associated protein 1 [Gekko japonicus]|uniref:RNA polymerase II-associated protein 1 n=1 Tax=Gekko japonicus TaxID=146911 RepID=A0ABM1LGA6_GEKJA|nr:PREDICTED: RNA polymerase II-associated protein 1 [Gekko japonicus]
MLPRPKPGESEADLLKFQNQFLASKASPAVKVVKKADKRRGDEGSGVEERLPLQHDRDVVSLDDFPDVPPTLPGPSKKPKFRSTHVHFEDPEEQMDHGDQHITAVLSKIIEHDTSAGRVTIPLSTGDPFPRVFHRSEIKTEAKPEAGRRSIFSQKIAAKRAAEVAQASPRAGQKDTERTTPDAPPPPVALEAQLLRTEEENSVGTLHTQQPRIVTGEGLGSLAGEQEAQKIHEENLERLQSMSKEEILEEQKRLLAQLDPNLVTFLMSRRGIDTSQKRDEKMELEKPEKLVHLETWSRSQHETEEIAEAPFFQEPAMDDEPDTEDSQRAEACIRMNVSGGDLPLKLQKEWLHMNNVEFEKLAWMKDLPHPRQRKTRKGMQARFSLKGELIPPDKDLPTYLGLHHHGEEAERAGYSLQELFHLSRSQVIQQRTLALLVLGHVVQKATAGEFASLLKGSVLRVLLDAGFLFLLRFSLDDTVDNVVAAAVHALHALLVSPDDEECLDLTFSWYQGMAVHPFIPNKEEEEEVEEEDEDNDNEQIAMENKSGRKSKDENKPDPEVARYDVIKGLLKTKILHRLRYILEVMKPVPLVVLEILDILIRIARHSTEVCNQVLDCPRLIETVVREFIPTQWDPRAAEPGQFLASVYGVPCATAMKLIRVLASGGRNAAARLLNKHEMKNRLSRFVAEDPKDLSLMREEAIRLSTEAFRLWAVAAGYGQACDLYRDLYPVLVKMIPFLSHLVKSSEENKSMYNLSIERATAIVTLLSQITQTAGCRAELQAQLSRSGPEDGDQIPPPPVSWTQVSGFRPLIETNLKKCLKEISELDTWEALQPLATTYVIYLGLYYNNCSQQPSVNTVDCLEEVERLTFEVVLPLLSQPAMQTQWEMLRRCSVLCNPSSCSPGPESVPSIVSLSCTGGKSPMSLVGSKSPFAFLTAFLVLVNSITHIHKGLIGKYASVLDAKGLNDYLLQSWTTGPPSVFHSSVWLLHHEYHLQYFVLSLAWKMWHFSSWSSVECQVSAFPHFQVQLADFLVDHSSEGQAGGPEAADFSDILHLSSRAKLTQPGSVASISPHPSRGALLKEAYQHLPFIQVCYLSHFAYLEPALARSRDAYQGRTHLIQSMLLPEVRGPTLPSDWPFLPLISLYNKVTSAETQWAVVKPFPVDLVNIMTRSLQWVLLLETWRPRILQGISAAAKLARLMCVFLTGSDLFLEGAVHCYTAALLSLYCRSKVLDSLNLDAPLPGLASFYDLYINLLEHFEAVSFGDPLFGVFVLLPLQRRFNVQLRLAVFGEHVSTLRALGVPLQQFPVPLELYLSPPEDNLNLLRQYFQTLVTGVLRHSWCPVLYVVAVAHVNSFIFSQENTTKEIDVARRNMLQKIWLLADEALKRHLLYYKLPNKESRVGFDLYEQLPPIRLKHLHTVTKKEHKEGTSLPHL